MGNLSKTARILVLAFGLSLVPASAAFAEGHRPPARHHKVSMKQARQTALARVAGTVRGHELEYEKGRWIYSFEIHVKGEPRSRIHEVNVDADSGRIVDVSVENDSGEGGD